MRHQSNFSKVQEITANDGLLRLSKEKKNLEKKIQKKSDRLDEINHEIHALREFSKLFYIGSEYEVWKTQKALIRKKEAERRTLKREIQNINDTFNIIERDRREISKLDNKEQQSIHQNIEFSQPDNSKQIKTMKSTPESRGKDATSKRTFSNLLHSQEEAKAIFNILNETGLLSAKSIKKAISTILKEDKLKDLNFYFRNPDQVKNILNLTDQGVDNFELFEQLLELMSENERVAFSNHLMQSFFRLPGEERNEQQKRLRGFFDESQKGLIEQFGKLGLTNPSPNLGLKEKKDLTIAVPGATATGMVKRIEHLVAQEISSEVPVYFLTGERKIFMLDKETNEYKVRLGTDNIELDGKNIIDELLKRDGKTKENLSEEDLAEYIAKNVKEKHNVNLRVLIGDRKHSQNASRVDTYATVYKLGEEIQASQVASADVIKVALFSNDEFRNGQAMGAVSALMSACGIKDEGDLTFERNYNEGEGTTFISCHDPKTNKTIIVYPQGSHNPEAELNIGLPSQSAAFLYGLTKQIYTEVGMLQSITQVGRVKVVNKFEEKFNSPINEAIKNKKEAFSDLNGNEYLTAMGIACDETRESSIATQNKVLEKLKKLTVGR